MTLWDLVEDWLRDTAMTGLVLVSLLGVVAAAFTGGGPVSTVLGVLAGLVATAAVLVPLVRHWSRSATWLGLGAVAAFDVAVIMALLSR